MRSIRHFSSITLLAGAFLCSPALLAEDIDLFTGSTSGGDPNVMIVLDNESNWAADGYSNAPAEAVALCGNGTYYCAQKYALVNLLQKTDANGDYIVKENVGIGLMMYGSGDNKGSYVRFGIRKMTPTNRAALIKVLIGLTVDDKGSSQQDFGMVMWEAFKYFGGGSGSPHSSTTWGPIPLSGVGTGTVKRDYPANPTIGSAFWANNNIDLPTYAYTSDSINNSGANPPVKYNSPPNISGCGKNYVVYVGHSNSQDANNNQPPATYFQAVGASTSRVMAGNREATGSYGDEATRYLFNSDVDPNSSGVQNIITYTIGTYEPPAVGQVAGMITTMKSMANVGGGSYYDATDIAKLAQAFEDILKEIQSVNSVFISPALPVSANIQGTYLNQVFIGMFRPDGDGSPKWLGNLKQYQLKFDAATNVLRLADADLRDAIDSAGTISVLARSFWTSTSSPNFWTNWMPTWTAAATDSPDGPEVQKGGAAQRLRETNRTAQAGRKVYTCPLDSTGAGACGATGTSLTGATYQFAMNGANTAPAFSTFAASKLAPAFNLPATTDADITNLINWVRGNDNLANELGPGGTTTVRPTIHGDIIHSRPVAMNYSGRIVVFYGANDGMLRAVEGKQTGTGAGEELWAFTPPEQLKQMDRLRQQTPKVNLPSSTTSSINNKSYFLDGSIGAYQEGSTAIIYVSARRGGNFMYAFDVSNPDDPRFKFKISPSTTGFGNLGQTWSVPKVTKIRDGSSTGRVVLIFGGGYDPAEDTDLAGTTGRGVYVVDALTGALIKHFVTTSVAEGSESIVTSIPSEVTIVNTDRDAKGYTDRGYVGDLAGNVWRIDLDDGSSSNDPAGWSLHKLAGLGSGKFFFPPDVVMTANFHAVLVGSGDREKPLLTTSTDKFYMIKDMKLGFDGSGQTTIVTSDLAQIGTSDDLATKKGWYYALATGEKVVNAPITIGGVAYYGTNKPITQLACEANVGEARSYAVDFFTGAGTRPPGGVGTGDDAYSIVLNPKTGLPPSPVAGLVDIGNGVVVPFCIGCGSDRRSSLEAEVPEIDPTPVRRKIYWKIKNDK